MLTFEYDQDKSLSNKDKHGIDFETAEQLWLDPLLAEIPANTNDEPRFLLIGRISDKHWSAIITYRNDNIRIISVRRSRLKEVEIYES
ncbi:MAG: toxin [Gammaproteobacteria bacterium]|nr:MAG: toxin [Gammaproteobacteria bacterium]